MDDDRWDEQVGSVAEEAQRLLESLRRAGGPSDGSATPAAEGTDDEARRGGRERDDADAAEGADDGSWTCTDPFCRSCPLCRTVAVVRGLSPETLRRLSDLATVAAGVLSDLAGDRDGRAAASDDAGTSGPRAEATGSSGPRSARAAAPSPIPVRDADDGTTGG